MFRGGSKVSPKQAKPVAAASTENPPNGLFSPRFKSMAAMAGWDEEALIIASTIVEDTPDRGDNNKKKKKKRCDLCFKTPPSTASRRKRMSRRNHNHVSPLIATLNLEEDENEEASNSKEEIKVVNNEEKKTQATELTVQLPEASSLNQAFPCLDKLKEELSCAICLEICFEPSTTPCGHSFCKKCLRSAADKCGKRCPKCRQLISNGRSCTINTVLWNTIQLIFPMEIEARKAAGVSPEAGISGENPRRSFRPPNVTAATRLRTRETARRESDDAALAERLQREDLSRLLRPEGSGRRRRGMTPSQDEDAALAFRLQREELMESFVGVEGSRATTTTTSSLSVARANLRAMASRAVMVRSRARPSS